MSIAYLTPTRALEIYMDQSMRSEVLSFSCARDVRIERIDPLHVFESSAFETEEACVFAVAALEFSEGPPFNCDEFASSNAIYCTQDTVLHKIENECLSNEYRTLQYICTRI